MSGPVVVLAGGTGGARLARGLLDVVGEDLVVVANTGDDVEVHGAAVSPDPDLVSYWLADRIDARGWGLEDDTFHVMDGLRELGRDIWFNLGDRDLAVCLDRAERLASGETPTQALAALGDALGLRARVLPMSDAPVRTHVQTAAGWRGLQEFLIVDHGAGPIEDVRFDGAEAAAPTPEVLEALASARAIIVGPSNPIISIGPILALDGMREALRDAAAPVVAVSPIVGGAVLKGPTQAFLAWAGRTADAAGIAAHYGDLLDGLVSDEPVSGPPALQTSTLLGDPESRAQVALEVLTFAEGLQVHEAAA